MFPSRIEEIGAVVDFAMPRCLLETPPGCGGSEIQISIPLVSLGHSPMAGGVRCFAIRVWLLVHCGCASTIWGVLRIPSDESR